MFTPPSSLPSRPPPAPAKPSPGTPPAGLALQNSTGRAARPASCNDCFYWHQPLGGVTPPTRSADAASTAWWSGAGYCRRSNPGPGAALVSQQRAGWPATHKDDWCGSGEVR